ncbi:MAG TPA: hypothetical protein VJM31_12040 [Vicinamibacterales bacterium]|nr:hypothetical protein [Vicinamibacterales bacterium]
MGAVVLLLGAALVWHGSEQSDRVGETLGMGFSIGFEVLYYWRLVHHLRDVAAFTSGEIERHTEES